MKVKTLKDLKNKKGQKQLTNKQLEKVLGGNGIKIGFVDFDVVLVNQP